MASLTLFQDIPPEEEKSRKTKKKAKSAGAQKEARGRVEGETGQLRGLKPAGPGEPGPSASLCAPAVDAVSLACPAIGCGEARIGRLAFCMKHQSMLPGDVQVAESRSREEGGEKHAKALALAVRLICVAEGRSMGQLEPRQVALPLGDPPEVKARIRATLEAAGLYWYAEPWEQAPSIKRTPPRLSVWERRVARGGGPIPAPGNGYPKLIPYDSLKESHPTIFAKYKKQGILMSDNYVPTPACLAKEIDEAFRQHIADALRRAGDQEGASSILRAASAPAVIISDDGDGIEPDYPLSTCDVSFRSELEPQSARDFRRASAKRLWLAHGREALRRAMRGAEKSASDRANRLLKAEADSVGNLIDPETGEVLTGPDSFEEARERRMREQGGVI